MSNIEKKIDNQNTNLYNFLSKLTQTIAPHNAGAIMNSWIVPNDVEDEGLSEAEGGDDEEGDPSSWKLSWVTMIPKPGKDSTKSGNYRPISLCATMGKILEKIYLKSFNRFLDEKKQTQTKTMWIRQGSQRSGINHQTRRRRLKCV